MVTVKIPFLDLLKVADSGQAFRFNAIDPTHVELVAFGRYLQITQTGKDTFAFSCTEKDFDSIWKPYFDLGRDYGSIVSSIKKDDKPTAMLSAGYCLLPNDFLVIAAKTRVRPRARRRDSSLFHPSSRPSWSRWARN